MEPRGEGPVSVSNFENSRLLTVQQAADRLNVSVRNIRHQIHQRRIPIVKIGRLVRIDEGELEAFIDRCRVGE